MKHSTALLFAGLLVLNISSAYSADSVSSPLADANARDTVGNTPLHRAALRGDADAVEALLARGADAGAVNKAGATPLHYGTASERIVAALLAHGAPADPVSSIGVTPLVGAVSRAESFAVAGRLIAAGANINAHRPFPYGPNGSANVLAIAILGGDRRTIALLLEHKADLNPREGATPLMIAAEIGDIESIRQLLDHGAQINAVYFSEAGTALNFAFWSGQIDAAKLLIERGADLSIKSTTGHGTPPMVWSAYHDSGDATITRVLVERGIDPNSANDLGETALSYALKRGPNTELVRYLRSIGANPPDAPAQEKRIPARKVPVASEDRATMIRASAQSAVDLLQRSSTAFLANGFVRQVNCTSCHQQTLPAVAFGWARERGLRVDELALGRQLAAQIAQRSPGAEFAFELDEPTPAANVTLGYDADGLYALRYAPDAITESISHYLVAVQRPDGSWTSYARRPPIMDGTIINTAWSARAVQLYPPNGRAYEAEDSLRRARAWLGKQQPPTQNERTFQLLGLAWANETTERMLPFANALIAAQRSDGGWAQLLGLASDAWATGSALVALYKAGFPSSHASYQRGVDYLLRTQFDDGSWWVRSRTWPFQPHFDSRFPHGKDQWISAAGTAWATMALLLTLEPTVTPANLPNGQQLIAAFMKSSGDKERRATAPARLASTPAAATVDFGRDIKPLLDRSCVDCHSGERPKGSFDLTTRESLLKGGQSGDPAIVPGYADDSPLIRNVSGANEDLEMPPLRRRNKFPALTVEEITRLRTWIDAGAPWPASPAPAPKGGTTSESRKELSRTNDRRIQP